MIDPIQILLTVIVTALTVLLVIIGIEIFRILQEVKRTLQRVNKILDDVEVITDTVTRPVQGMSSLLTGVRQGAGIIKILNNFFRDRAKKENEDDENGDSE